MSEKEPQAAEEAAASEEVVVEVEDLGEAGPSAEDYKKLEDEKAVFYDQLLRLKAEFENFRKRVDRDKPGLIAHGRQDLLERLLPLYDVLLTAHQHLGAPGEGAANDETAKGLELIFTEFSKLFKNEGIEPIPCVGAPYDFNKHEVVGNVETDEHEEGTVVEEVQRGYLLGGKVLRAAKVRVAKHK